MLYAVGNMSMPWLDEQVVCNLYTAFFSHSCFHTDGAGHGNDLCMEDLIIFQRSFWRCWLHLVICQLSGVRFWPRAEAHVELIWHAVDGTPVSVWAHNLLLLIWQCQLISPFYFKAVSRFALRVRGCEAVPASPSRPVAYSMPVSATIKSMVEPVEDTVVFVCNHGSSSLYHWPWL